MVVTINEINLINFPIYALPSDDLEVADGLLRIGNLVLDDRNQIGDTLGKRRLQTPHKVLPLKHYYEGISELIRSRRTVFIDTKGYCFIYQKTKMINVTYHRILEVLPKDIVTVLKLQGISFPVVVKRPPPLGKSWVGMLNYGKRPWIPYEYSEEYCMPIRRKI